MYLKGNQNDQLNNANFGFTLIEVLVVIVIVGIIGAAVGPNLFNLLSAYERQTSLGVLEGRLAGLPVEMRLKNEAQEFATPNDLGVDLLGKFEPILRIEANGFCHETKLEVNVEDQLQYFLVLAPYCELQRAEL